MIRFMADSWLEAILRPVMMALPMGGVYVEPIAPDFRFVFALLLAIAWILVLVRARRRPPAAVAALLAFCGASFVPWMMTSGNGRYFIATLLLVGPLALGLLHQLPLTRAARVTGAVLMLASQAFLAREVVPWHSWGLVEWKEPPAFGVDVPQDLVRQPATYISMSTISYSLIAPAFHPRSRWISLASQQGRPIPPAETRRVQQLLATSQLIYLIFPSPPGEPVQGAKITDDLAEALDAALAAHGLRMTADRACRLLRSRGLTALGLQPDESPPTDPELQRGFWVCPATRTLPESKPVPPAVEPRVQAVFERIETTCPRLFPPGSATNVVLSSGVRRYYIDSDMRLLVGRDGEVWYKYIRNMNAVMVGTIDQVLAPSFRFQCDAVRGRGMPWDREI